MLAKAFLSAHSAKPPATCTPTHTTPSKSLDSIPRWRAQSTAPRCPPHIAPAHAPAAQSPPESWFGSAWSRCPTSPLKGITDDYGIHIGHGHLNSRLSSSPDSSPDKGSHWSQVATCISARPVKPRRVAQLHTSQSTSYGGHTQKPKSTWSY